MCAEQQNRSNDNGYRCVFLYNVQYLCPTGYNTAAAFHRLILYRIPTTLQRLIQHYNNVVKTNYTCTAHTWTAHYAAAVHNWGIYMGLCHDYGVF